MLAVITISLLACGFCSAQSSNTLSEGRKKIDSLDKALLRTLGERERIVKDIGVYKAKNYIAPLQAARFQEVLNKAIEAGKKEGLSAQFITALMNAIHEESLRIERDSMLNK